jgi:hypothetical protein
MKRGTIIRKALIFKNNNDYERNLSKEETINILDNQRTSIYFCAGDVQGEIIGDQIESYSIIEEKDI